ncbi:MAG: hypothetical protein Q9160_002730 [Pyrenula sp. 1 TL-2023]
MLGNTIFFAFLLQSTFHVGEAQVQTTCNPILTNGCPGDPALSSTFQWDFTKGQSTSFYTDSWWLPFISYDKTNGATFSITRKGIAPTLTSKFYVMFGRFEIAIKSAAGTGIISDVILQSDDQDEIDLEWVSGQSTQVQTNYYSLRNRPPVYNQGFTHELKTNLQTDFHAYTVDWNADRILFSVDGKTIRAVNSQNDDQYPRTPMKVSIGLWAGGDPDNAPGTIQWAGGATDYSHAPFNMSIKSIKVVDYSTGDSYNYTDTSGSTDSIIAVKGKINPHGTDAGSKSDVSKFTDVGTAVTTSAVSSTSIVASHSESSVISTSNPQPISASQGTSAPPPASSQLLTAQQTSTSATPSPTQAAPSPGSSANQQSSSTPAASSPDSSNSGETAAAPLCSKVNGSTPKIDKPVCGKKLTAGKQTYNLQCDTDSYGGDLCFTTNGSLEQCVARCNAEKGCIGVIYKQDSKFCYLKAKSGVVYHQDGTQWVSILGNGAVSSATNAQGATSAGPGSTQITISPA